MSILEGARRDLFFSDLSADERDPWMDLNNFTRKGRTFDSPAEEIKWRTEKLMSEVREFQEVKPDFKPPKLDEFKLRVGETMAEGANCDTDDEYADVLKKVRKLAEEMKEIQLEHKRRIWNLLEDMDREIQEDPDYLDKIGVPGVLEDSDEDSDRLYRGFGFPDGEEAAIRRQYSGHDD
ncbi:hypothetical protein FA13DRAFT_1732445 [Coprinellus micaceus]|uniref:Uncharacterized protein n=1 Tax=Coprinellus micaceus TaxID=71717 RepID=A0A4Y7TBQ4_COPMI|nr:hypothetical protein FA13DRAFT_1732445 [Coprinellus micaceus]